MASASPTRLLSVSLMLASTVVAASIASAQICGDADGTGGVTLTDGVQTLRAAVGLPSQCSGRVCDMDGSGDVTTIDGVNVLRRSAGLSARTDCGTRFGEIVKVRVQGVEADVHLEAPPVPPVGAPQDVVSVTGPASVPAGGTATFTVQLARPVDSLIFAFSEGGATVDGFAELAAGSGGGAVEVVIDAGTPAGGAAGDFQIASRTAGELGAFKSQTIAIVPADKVTCSEGVIDEPMPFPYDGDSDACDIGNPTDIDTFAFQGTAGDDVRILVAGYTDYFDARIEVRDPNGTVVADSYCDAYIPCSVGVGSLSDPPAQLPILITSGRYIVSVSDAGANNTGSYTLHIERLRPVNGRPLAMNGSISDQISPAPDIDSYTFQGTAGDQVRILVAGATDYFDARIEVRDPDGVVVADNYCDAYIPCSVGVDPEQSGTAQLPTLTKSGSYTASVSDAGANNSGGYAISVTCLFGPCL